MQSRQEKMDPDGSKTGFYSFVDASGLFRRVEYVADGKGFRATVTTNEPGTVSSEPAHVRVLSENGRNAFRHAIQNSPQLEYSSKIFARYNLSSDLIHDKDGLINPQGNTDIFKKNSFFDKSAVFGPNFEELSSPKDSSFSNAYKGSALPLRSILPLSPKYPEIPDSKFQEFNLEKYFNKPDMNSDYVFGDKLSNKDFEKDYTVPLYGSKLSANSQSSTGKRYHRRHRDSRARAKRRHVLKIHIPEGYEDHPDLPLYRDK
ncbi:Cuticle protein 16.8, partial [Stegodyphus mimosarum]